MKPSYEEAYKGSIYTWFNTKNKTLNSIYCDFKNKINLI